MFRHAYFHVKRVHIHGSDLVIIQDPAWIVVSYRKAEYQRKDLNKEMVKRHRYLFANGKARLHECDHVLIRKTTTQCQDITWKLGDGILPQNLPPERLFSALPMLTDRRLRNASRQFDRQFAKDSHGHRSITIHGFNKDSRRVCHYVKGDGQS